MSPTAQTKMVFEESGRTHVCDETETIMAAAGIAVPFGCSMGICGTCRGRKISGEVHMVHNGGISDEEIAKDYFLACCLASA